MLLAQRIQRPSEQASYAGAMFVGSRNIGAEQKKRGMFRSVLGKDAIKLLLAPIPRLQKIRFPAHSQTRRTTSMMEPSRYSIRATTSSVNSTGLGSPVIRVISSWNWRMSLRGRSAPQQFLLQIDMLIGDADAALGDDDVHGFAGRSDGGHGIANDGQSSRASKAPR